MHKNTVEISIMRCQHCPDFHYGEHGDYFCSHPEAPYDGQCFGLQGIPDECPRFEVQAITTNTKPIVVIVNGFPTAGKDEFCKIANKKYKTFSYSTVDTVKEIAIMLGWNGIKTPETRNMLSALKDFYVKWFDGTFREMVDLINQTYRDYDDQFLFLHTREPEEIMRVVEWCSENDKICYTVFIDRDVEESHGNHADSKVKNYIYDMYVHNDYDENVPGSGVEFKQKSLDIFANMVDNNS